MGISFRRTDRADYVACASGPDYERFTPEKIFRAWLCDVAAMVAAQRVGLPDTKGFDFPRPVAPDSRRDRLS
jgi:hypothetical protein